MINRTEVCKVYSDIVKNIVDKLDNKEVLTKINSEGERILAVDFLNSVSSEITDISKLNFNITTKQDSMYLLCKFNDTYGYKCKGGIKVEESLDKTLIELINLIINGQNMINKLNKRLEDRRVETGNILNIKYRWGNNKYGSIAYWDYTHVTVRINKDALNELVSKNEEEQDKFIDTLVSDLTWTDNPVEFISKYNESEIAKRSNTNIENDELESLLTKNMLNYSDIEEQILKSKAKTGFQKFKSVLIVKELGLFAGIVLWDIDYEIKDISANIMDDRIIDMENNLFISDHSLFSRIEQRVKEQADSLKNKLSKLD